MRKRKPRTSKEMGKNPWLHFAPKASERDKALYDAEAQRRNGEVHNFEVQYFSKESEAVIAYTGRGTRQKVLPRLAEHETESPQQNSRIHGSIPSKAGKLQ